MYRILPLKFRGIAVHFAILALSLILFVLLFGQEFASTKNLSFYFREQISEDPKMHYLGWVFYRTTDWMMPIGLNPKFGLELSSSIVFSDSIPLLAIFFKVFDRFIDDTFHYFGIWLFVCLYFQMYFSFKILNLFIKEVPLCLLASVLFVFSPTLLFRMTLHYSLSGHFLILAALWISLLPNKSNNFIYWICLLIITAGVHAYLLAMVLLLAVSSVLIEIKKSKSIFVVKPLFWYLKRIFFVSLVPIAMWNYGYFSLSNSIAPSGFGQNNANLNTFINPVGWSFFFADLPQRPGDQEGFSYLGLGAIFLIFIAGSCCLVRWQQAKLIILKFKNLVFPLLILGGLAISNNIGINDFVVRLIIPEFIQNNANLFRANGRFIWPVYYIILLLSVIIAYNFLNKKIVFLFFCAALALQILDTSSGWMKLRHYDEKRVYTSRDLSVDLSLDWNALSSQFSKLRLLEPRNIATNWAKVALIAATFGFETDAVYLARIDEARVFKLKSDTRQKLSRDRLDMDTIYVINEPLNTTKVNLGSRHYLRTIDDLDLLIPWVN